MDPQEQSGDLFEITLRPASLDEYINVKTYTLPELEEMIYSGTIEDSKTIAAILAYKNKFIK